MKLKFFGGVKEIGGNKILLEENNRRIFLDFGKSYQEVRKYFEEFLQPRVVHGVKDYLALNLIPCLEGLYRQDLLRILRKDKGFAIPLHKTPAYEGVLLSHAHLDHAAYISFLDENISVFVSSAGQRVLESFAVTRPPALENEIIDFPLRHLKERKKRKARKFQLVQDRKEFQIGSFKITPFFVDHSIPGATMYLIKSSSQRLLYSGDFRVSEMSLSFKNSLFKELKKEKIDIFLCEGTRVKEKTILTENDVFEKAFILVKNTPALVITDYSLADIKRITTLIKVAQATGRKFVVPLSNYYYLSYLAKHQEIDEQLLNKVLVYARKKTQYRKWEKEILKEKKAIISAEKISQDQNRYLVGLSFYQVQELIDLNPQWDKSLFLRAITEAHNEESEFSEERLINWVNFFGMRGVDEKTGHFERAHISGHISGKELEEFIENIKPKTVIPIHTEQPEEFKKFHHNVIIVEKGETYET